MLSLQRYIVLLVAWIAFFFNIERLHVSRNALINITMPTYILVTIIVILGLMLPLWHQSSALPFFAFAFFSFAATKLWSNIPYWDDTHTYLTLFELTSVMVTAFLAYRVGQLIVDIVETVHALLLTEVGKRVYPKEQAEFVAKHEMLLARRRNYSLSMLLIEADTKAAQIKLSTTAQEIQHLLTRRMGQVTLTRLLATNLRTSDSIVDASEQGRWLLMTAELDRSNASAILDRLNKQATNKMGIKLKFGIANYPEQGLTFGDLIVIAEQDLRADHTLASGETTMDATDLVAQESISNMPPKNPESIGYTNLTRKRTP